MSYPFEFEHYIGDVDDYVTVTVEGYGQGTGMIAYDPDTLEPSQEPSGLEFVVTLSNGEVIGISEFQTLFGMSLYQEIYEKALSLCESDDSI